MADDRAAVARAESGERVKLLADLLAAHEWSAAAPEPLVALAAAAVPASERASLTVVGMEERWETVVVTDAVAAELTAIQLELGEGPSLDTVERADVVHVPDLEADLRWPGFARRAVPAGVRSVLALRTNIENFGRAALAFYAARPQAFTELDLDVARIVGWLVSATLQGERLRQRAANLEIALETNRHIGSAIGILMARELLTAEQAFERLRDTSQRLHRKLRDVARDVINTGELPRVD